MLRRIARIAVRVGAVLIALGSVAFLAAWAAVARGHLVDRAHFAHPDDAVTVVDRHGLVLRHARAGSIDRRWVPLREISPTLVNAVIAAEDSDFRAHGGVDARAIARAAVLDLLPWHVRSGASTITQQLVKAVYGRHGFSPWAKSLEALRAIALERMLSKDEILEQYLNRVPFGDEIEGVARASQEYFGCAPSALTVAQAALLAGVPQAPTITEPRRHLARAIARRNYVLARMLSTGAIDRAAYAASVVEPVVLAARATRPYEAARFVDSVMRTRGERSAAERDGTLTTTLDLALQREVESLARATVSQFSSRGASNAAVVVVANDTGEILAYVGAARAGEFPGGALDLLASRRQPGSTLKPFVYEMLFERGATAATLLDDLATGMTGAGGETFDAHDYDRHERGPVRARVALSASLNLAALDAARRVGADGITTRLRALGVALDGDANRYGAAIVLGGAGVTALELAQGYMTLARGGTRIPLALTPGGSVHPVRVMNPAAARIAWDILVDGDARRDGFGDDLERLAGGAPFALKTGTSTGWRDAWSAAADASFTVAVWLGDPNGNGMAEVSGFQAAAPLAARVLALARARAVADGVEPVARVDVDLVEVAVCAHTGLRAGASCTRVVRERFVAGTVPRETCNAHLPDGTVRVPARYRAWVERAHPAGVTFAQEDSQPADGELVVQSPSDGARLLIDGSRGPTVVPLRAAVRGRVDPRVTWEIDSSPLRDARWIAAPGRHTIVAIAGSRRSRVASVTVDRMR